ncbi:hypothetical protein V8F20_000997 [Naviculisporaceae sp. PSN 640]
MLQTELRTRGRYEDGEVRRYGAGESYRPYNRDRSPRPARSPPRSMRSPVRDRDRGRTPPGGSDSYVPGRSPPRRRSRSNDRFRRRERSRDPEPWRRRERSRSRPRSPIRRSSPPPRQRSPMRRSPPRFSSPRRDERRDDRRDDRDERPRSPPRRHFDNRDVRPRSRSPFDRDRAPRRNRSPFRRSPPAGPRGGSYRPRSRSIDRRGDREDRYPGPPFRRPSIPPRDSVNSSAINSRSASGRSSPRPTSRRGLGSRSRPHTPARGSPMTRAASPTPVSAPPQAPSEPADRDRTSGNNTDNHSSLEPSELRDSAESRQQTRVQQPPKQPAQHEDAPRPPRSPPKGPAALRAPPTGPASSRNFTSPAPQHAQPHRSAQTPNSSSRSDITSPPTVPPAGPRGYVPPPRGGGGFGGGRGGRGGGGGGWNNNSINPRHMPGPSVSPTIPPTGPSGIPTGPRAGTTNPPSTTSSPSLGGGGGGSGGGTSSSNNANNNNVITGPKPFNPPTGPASHSHAHSHHSHHHGHGHGPPRQPLSLAQSLISNMPPIIPGGKPDPTESHISLGITKELEPHFRKLMEDEERQREELRNKQEKLRKNLKIWDRMERESKAFELKSDLSEKSLRALAGEGGYGYGYGYGSGGGPSF